MEDLTGSAPPSPSIRIIRLHDLEHETEKWLSRKQRRPSGPKKSFDDSESEDSGYAGSADLGRPNFSNPSVQSSSSYGYQPPDRPKKKKWWSLISTELDGPMLSDPSVKTSSSYGYQSLYRSAELLRPDFYDSLLKPSTSSMEFQRPDSSERMFRLRSAPLSSLRDELKRELCSVEDRLSLRIPPGKSAGITVTPKAPAVTAAAMAVVVGAEASSAA